MARMIVYILLLAATADRTGFDFNYIEMPFLGFNINAIEIW